MEKEKTLNQSTEESTMPMPDWGGSMTSASYYEMTQEQVSDVYKEGTIDQAIEEENAKEAME